MSIERRIGVIDQTSNNNRIAKNTLLLYGRMFAMMLLYLYTSRVVLKALGVTDYGIYNAVGGIVAMLMLISGAMSNAIMRYITYELGKNDMVRLQKVFSVSLNVMFIISIIVFILGETVGCWFLNNQMNIPSGRLNASNWILQFTLLSFVVNLISIPYNSSIIAHEKMDAYTFISILDASLKLVVAYMLYYLLCDKLIVYAILLFVVALINRSICAFYCKKNFEECHYLYVFDKNLFRSIFSFAGWNFLGQGAFLLNGYGVDLLMNLFFGVRLNAARGIANQVNVAVGQFANNLRTALNPQITKSYAVNDLSYMHSLIFIGAKLSYFLMLLFVIPIGIEAMTILKLWLGEVPEYTIVFVRLTLISALINSINGTLITGLHASGKMKKYQIVVGFIEASVFLLTYFVYRMGARPEMAYIINIVIYLILSFVRLYLIKDLIGMSGCDYVKKVFVKITIVTAVSVILPLIIYLDMESSLLRLIIVWFMGIVSILASVYLLGLSKVERAYMTSFIKKQLHCVSIYRS